MKVKINLGGREIEFDAERRGNELFFEFDGRKFQATLLEQDDHSAVLLLNGRKIRLAAHLDGAQRQLWVEGRTLAYQRLAEHGAAASVDTAALSTTIPAVVSQVLVALGDTVEEGEKLILLESMKMVIPIIAPHSGTVTAIHCTAGEAVQPGVALLTIGE